MVTNQLVPKLNGATSGLLTLLYCFCTFFNLGEGSNNDSILTGIFKQAYIGQVSRFKSANTRKRSFCFPAASTATFILKRY